MSGTDSLAPLPASPPLSDSQLEALAELGEKRTAEVGETLFRVGDQRFPFIAIIEGEVAILDPGGHEIVRHGNSNFLGELSLLSGQTAFLSAVATQPLRYIAVDRDVLRALLYEDGPLSDVLLSTFIARREALQRVQDVGVEVVGPRSSQATMRMLEFLRAGRLPFTWHEEADGLDPSSLPVVRLPGGAEMLAPSTGQVSRALGIGRELGPREEVDLLVVGAGPAGLGAAVYGASEGLDTLVDRRHGPRRTGGFVTPDRELPRVPRGNQRDRADQPRRHPGAEVRRAAGDAVPRRIAGAGERPAHGEAGGGA